MKHQTRDPTKIGTSTRIKFRKRLTEDGTGVHKKLQAFDRARYNRLKEEEGAKTHQPTSNLPKLMKGNCEGPFLSPKPKVPFRNPTHELCIPNQPLCGQINDGTGNHSDIRFIFRPIVREFLTLIHILPGELVNAKFERRAKNRPRSTPRIQSSR